MLWLGVASEGGLEHAESPEALRMLACSAYMRRGAICWKGGGRVEVQACGGVAEVLGGARGALGPAADDPE